MEKPTQTVDSEVDDMSLGLSAEKQNPDDNKTNSEADTAAGKESSSSSLEEQCLEELDKRHENKFKNPVGFLQKLHNEKGPSLAAMATACWDLKGQMELAGADDGQEFTIRGYTDDLLLCLSEEKESVEELLIYLDELAVAFQAQIEELTKGKEGAGEEGAKKEDKFKDARRDWVYY